MAASLFPRRLLRASISDQRSSLRSLSMSRIEGQEPTLAIGAPALFAQTVSLIEPYFFRSYGDWFVGLRETFSLLARVRTEPSVRPSFRPITLVGVFSRASCRSCRTSADVQGFPEFLVYLGIFSSSSESEIGLFHVSLLM